MAPQRTPPRDHSSASQGLEGRWRAGPPDVGRGVSSGGGSAQWAAGTREAGREGCLWSAGTLGRSGRAQLGPRRGVAAAGCAGGGDRCVLWLRPLAEAVSPWACAAFAGGT